jgi:hypothetical protein
MRTVRTVQQSIKQQGTNRQFRTCFHMLQARNTQRGAPDAVHLCISQPQLQPSACCGTFTQQGTTPNQLTHPKNKLYVV